MLKTIYLLYFLKSIKLFYIFNFNSIILYIMPSSIVVELNENNSIQNSAGDYKVLLKNPIRLDKGDVVKLKSCALDTITSQKSSEIDVLPRSPGDTTLDLSVSIGYYYNDWGCSFLTDDGTGTATNGNAGGTGGDNKTFDTMTDDTTAGAIPTRVPRSGLPFVMNYTTAPQGDNRALKFLITEIDVTLGPPQQPVKSIPAFVYTIGFTGNVSTDRDGNPLSAPTLCNMGFNISYDASAGSDTLALIKQLVVNNKIKLNAANYKLLDDKHMIARLDLASEINPQAVAFGELITFTGTGFPICGSVSGDPPNDATLLIPKVGKYPASGYVDANGNGVSPAETNVASIDNIVFTQVGGGTEMYKLYTETINLSLECGTYQAHEISQELTRQLTSLQTNAPSVNAKINNDYQLSFNPITKTIRQLMNEPRFTTHGNSAPNFIRPYKTGNSKFEFVTTKGVAGGGAANTTDVNYVIGSSQFGIVYDEGHDKMQIAQIHNHLYDSIANSGNSTPQVRVLKTTDGLSTVTGCCGIFITDMQPKAFWIGDNSQMKFGEDLLVSVGSRQATEGGGQVIIYDFPLKELEEGVNITTDKLGIDSLITKNRAKSDTALNSGFDVAINTNIDVVSSVLDVIGINAAAPLNPVNDVTITRKKGGYFKLEVDMPNIKQDIRESDKTNNKIQAIISRFYNDGEYTTAYDEGSIPFIYEGNEPSYIDSFNVRILEPNGELATSLGSTSSVFMQIDKAN